MSFLRRLSATLQTVPTAGFTRTPSASDLSPRIKDDVFRWQVGAKDFARVDADTLLRAEIAANDTMARKVIEGCHALRIVDPATGHPDTARIDRTLASKMPVMSVPKQRELVMLLFFWEEELSRWRMFEAEERQIEAKLAEAGLSDSYKTELRFALQIAQGEQRVWPSRRKQNGEIVRGADEPLPTYTEAQRYC